MLIVASNSSIGLARKLSAILGVKLSGCSTRRFPDGELYVRIESDLRGQDVVVIGNTRSDSDILETLFLLNSSRENGASTVKLIIPYYGYARQHMIYKPGESVSSRAILKTMENWADEIICVEIHDTATVGFATKPFTNVEVIDSLAEFFKGKKIDLVISPDDGGFSRAQKLAGLIGSRALFIEKKRIDSRTVQMSLPEGTFSGKNILLVDDIISTGGTIIKAIGLLRAKSAGQIFVTAIHGVFASGSQSQISAASDGLWVTDTIDGEFSSISVARDLAKVLDR
jgi:ribose-phosphate pyrophosphokinase